MSHYLESFMKQYSEEDRSYPSPEMQLHWRLEALKSRLAELVDEDFAYQSPLILTEEDIKYSAPEHLYSIRHVEAAIEIAEFELRKEYVVLRREEKGIKRTQLIPFTQKNVCEASVG